MASPQKEDGFTAIANEVMDRLCKIRIPGEERQVLDAIFRKTYGWNKCEDSISLSQFVELTGLNKQHIIQSIKGLLLKKVIIVTEKGNEPAKVYKFNKDYDQWEPLPKKVINVTEKGNPSLPKKVPTKETTTKEKKTREDFEIFWKAYPKKSGSKSESLKQWGKLNGTRPSIEIILEAIRKQIEWREAAKPGEFRPEWKDPERWIKGKMWESEVETNKARNQQKPLTAEEEWNQIQERLRQEAAHA